MCPFDGGRLTPSAPPRDVGSSHRSNKVIDARTAGVVVFVLGSTSHQRQRVPGLEPDVALAGELRHVPFAAEYCRLDAPVRWRLIDSPSIQAAR